VGIGHAAKIAVRAGGGQGGRGAVRAGEGARTGSR
jgi:hypothetical protein